MQTQWLCPGCGTLTSDPTGHVLDCDKVDGGGNALAPTASRIDEALAWLFDVDPSDCPHAGVLYEYITLLESNMDEASIAEWRRQANANTVEED